MIDFDILKRFQAKAKNRVGLDIGNNVIKMVEVSGPADKLTLVSFGSKKIQDMSHETVVQAIKSLAAELAISAKDVNISLAGSSLVARLISMPKMTDDELASAVRFETEKFIPFDINECVLDFHVQGPAAREKNDVDILLAAAKKDFVMQKIKLAEEAGFTVNLVDVDSFAITNAFLKNFPPIDPAKTIALLNIGAAYTSLIILKSGQISFVRDVSIGTNDFNAAVAKKCGVTLDMVGGLVNLPGDKAADIAGCARTVLSALLDEVKLSFGYHENQSGRGIDEIYVSGGGTRFPVLEEIFTEMLGSKPLEWNPFQFLSIDPAKINIDEIARAKDSFAVAVGLILR